MRTLIIAAMIVPALVTGALAATTHGQKEMRAAYTVSAETKQAMEKATCTFEPSTGTYGHCDGDAGRSGRL